MTQEQDTILVPVTDEKLLERLRALEVKAEVVEELTTNEELLRSMFGTSDVSQLADADGNVNYNELVEKGLIQPFEAVAEVSV